MPNANHTPSLNPELLQRIDTAELLRVAPATLFIDSPFQTRTSYPEADHLSLIESLNQVGQLQPGIARRTEVEGREVLELIVGNRRARAILDARCSLNVMLVRVPSGLNDDECREIAAHENNNRTDPTPYDIAADVHRYVYEVYGGQRKAISQTALVTNRDARGVRRYLALYAAAEESPLLKRAAQRQGFKLTVLEAWEKHGAIQIEKYCPSCGQEAEAHALRMTAVEELLRKVTPERTTQLDDEESLTVAQFSSHLQELVALLPGQSVKRTEPSARKPLLTTSRSGVRKLRSISVEPDVSEEQLQSVMLEVTAALIPLFGGRDEASLEALRHELHDVVRSIEDQVNGLLVARQESPRYKTRRGSGGRSASTSTAHRPGGRPPNQSLDPMGLEDDQALQAPLSKVGSKSEVG